jgi:superfamily II DNA or RNA helicase
MSLKDSCIKSEYRSLIDNVVQDFYVPLLKEAVTYRRAVGFFSSSSLVDISKGIAAIAKRRGKIQLVASPYLSDEDIEAIRNGYEKRNVIIENALLSQLSDENMDFYSMERLNLLANLIAEGILDIRIAYTEDDRGIGMYHEKMGIIEDAEGNKVAFSGSMNESSTAMSINYETIDVFRSWGDEFEANQAQLKENAFVSIWNDTEPNIHVLEFPSISQALIDKYKKKRSSFDIDELQFFDVPIKRKNVSGKRIGARIPKDISLYEYQKEAIVSWTGENYRGIFDMATGTGKTLTGLGAVSKLSEDVCDELSVFILCPYQHLVEQWVEDIVKFNIKPIIGYSASPQKDWKKRLQKAIKDQKFRKDKSFFCFVTTNATFSSKFVQDIIEEIKTPILLMVDEAHNVGAKTYAKLLDDRFQYRLALSATLDRHRDEEGTAALYNFFGRKCIEYTLERAIREDKLTPYKYYPIVVYLNEDELATYEYYTQEISKCIIKDKNGKTKLNSYGETLAIKRSRVIAAAAQKLDALRREIAPYKNKNSILVYCGATNVINENADRSETDEGDIRQITAVTRILGNEFDMSVAKFTADESMDERNQIKANFSKGERLQVVVAIKCLDEGMNIPGIRTAFILASTTNPKEYIQRRGRVLRKAPGKNFAEIYDFVTLPRPLDDVYSLTKEAASKDLALVHNELERIKEFGRLAINSMDSHDLIWDIEEAYHLTEATYFEGDDFYE